MIPTNRASLSLQVDNLLKVRLSMLDLDEFPSFLADIRITLSALCHAIAEPLDLSTPALYHYRALLAKLQVRLNDAEREYAARQAEQVQQQMAAEGDGRRRGPGHFGKWRMRPSPPLPDDQQ